MDHVFRGVRQPHLGFPSDIVGKFTIRGAISKSSDVHHICRALLGQLL